MALRPRPAGRLARLVRSIDFERVLGARRRAATPHFAVYHVAARPTPPGTARARPAPLELSTSGGENGERSVDDSPEQGLATGQAWVGAVVPKRHARRAVTRSLIKRQIYSAAERFRDRLDPGLWIVRLRAPFDRARFVSAASVALRHDARAELDALLDAAASMRSKA